MRPFYELDHVFICADIGAPEAELLVKFGLTEGSRNTHPGQGTANRRFFFRNAMIELFYVTDAVEASSESVRRIGLLKRWQQRRRKASPFGICLRPKNGEAREAPFSAWSYRPSYSPVPIYMGTNSLQVIEPLLFYMPFGRKPEPSEQPLEHEIGFAQITAVRIKGPKQSSAEIEEIKQTGVVEFIIADEPVMEIGFDGEVTGRSEEFSPALPLKLCW